MWTLKDCRVRAHGRTASIINELSPGTVAEFTVLDGIVIHPRRAGWTAVSSRCLVGALPLLLGVRVVIGGGSND